MPICTPCSSAAESQGRTLTDFVVSALQEAAQRAVEQAAVGQLSLANQACLAQALMASPEAAPALARAFSRRRKLVLAK